MIRFLPDRSWKISRAILRLNKFFMSPEMGTKKPARDTYAHPPDHICDAYWKYNKIRPNELEEDLDVVDFRRGLSAEQRTKLYPIRTVESSTIQAACRAFKEYTSSSDDAQIRSDPDAPECTVYAHEDYPGLQIYPSLLPPETQVLLLSRLMHRDLSNPHHKTNITAEYHVSYPEPKSSKSRSQDKPAEDQSNLNSMHSSFFSLPQASKNDFLLPLNPSTHKPLNMVQFLAKKLRWLTLGDQYDWPTRSYSGSDFTRFPSDIAELVSGLFPGLRSESGVVLLYSPKDYMPVHRDVSEQCERGLASFSLGCDGLFVIAKDTVEGEESDGKTVVIRVRSGDVVQMSGETRWAWHAMPKVLAGTCPSFLTDWPAGSENLVGEDSRAFERWRGYMASKRLNISCRQVWD